MSTMPPNEAPLGTIYPRNGDDQEQHATIVAAVPDNQIRVENKLYSTEKLASLHPGGPLFIKVQICKKNYASFCRIELRRGLFTFFRSSQAVTLLRPSFHTTVAIFHTIVQGLHWRGWTIL